jgi:RNA polymerase sigma factor (sigma-70 family)
MLDPALQGVLDAASDEEAERRLDTLVEDRVAPLVRTIVSRKLSASGSKQVFRPEDLEDVVGDAILVLLPKLQSLRTSPGAEAIVSLDAYAAAVTYSVCAHHLRRRYPERARVKDRLRYVLGRDRRFALWEIAGLGLHAGLSSWRGRDTARGGTDRLAELEREPARWPASWKPPAFIDRADPAPLLQDIFTVTGCPLEFDRLVNLVATIWQVDRVARMDVADRLDRLADVNPAPEVTIDRRRFTARVWTEIQQLPVRQRHALLLNLRDSQGAGLLWTFPVTGVASLRAIAAVLEIPAADLAALWRQLPLDDAALAERLDCTRQQVINLRMSARKRLNNRLRDDDARDDVVTGAANLREVSVSMGRDT